MTFLPIVARELRVAARRPLTYRTRWVAAAIALGLATVVMSLSLAAPSPAAMGPALFRSIAFPLLVFCLFEGARTTADCLSEEKREGTLGLLFLTDLRGYDVVLGKLLATSLRIFYAVMAVLPLLGIALTMGGVTGGQFWRTALGLLLLLVFSLCTGLFVSALSRESRTAFTGTGALVALVCLLPYALHAVAQAVPLAWPPTLVPGLSPLATFLAAEDLEFRRQPAVYWAAVQASLGWSVLFLGLASWWLPRSWQERGGTTRVTRRRQRRLARNPAAVRAARRTLLDRNPMLWLVARQSGERFSIWLVLGLAVVGWAVAFAHGPLPTELLGTGSTFTCMVLGWLLRIGVAGQACRTFAEARTNGTLELLLATPLSARDMVQGHFHALRRTWLGPTLTLIALVAILAGAAILEEDLVPMLTPGLLLLLYEPLKLAVDLLAVAAVGTWWGLQSAKPNAATVKTLLVVLVLPSLVFCVPRVISDLIFLNWALGRLRTRFRSEVEKQLGYTNWRLPWPPLTPSRGEAHPALAGGRRETALKSVPPSRPGL